MIKYQLINFIGHGCNILYFDPVLILVISEQDEEVLVGTIFGDEHEYILFHGPETGLFYC